MEKMLVVNPDLCTACRICELVCSFKHHEEFNPEKSRIRINMSHKDFYYFPRVCKQCDEAPCIDECPADALFKDPVTGIVSLNRLNCTGCKSCIEACPFGAMGFDSTEEMAEKCNLCDGDPECVKYCFFKALEY